MSKFKSMSEGDDEQIPQHQPWSPPGSDDEIAEEQLRTLKRERPIWGGKRPMVFGGRYDEEIETPDLGAYFEEWNLSEKKQILMCRGYASYLAAKQDARKK